MFTKISLDVIDLLVPNYKTSPKKLLRKLLGNHRLAK